MKRGEGICQRRTLLDPPTEAAQCRVRFRIGKIQHCQIRLAVTTDGGILDSDGRFHIDFFFFIDCQYFNIL
jgi:hypothetical protein